MNPWLPLAITLEGVLVGVAVLGAGVLVALLTRWILGLLLRARGRSESAAQVFSRLSAWLIAFIGFAAALTIAFPSVKPVDILGGVGVVSLAAGIAFQTVLGNMFAGMVILSRDRYRVGDQIQVGDHRGTIVAMQLSYTSIRTFDGRLELIPNGQLHSEIVTVQTGYERVRTSVSIDLDEGTDLDAAVRTALEAMSELATVATDPPPEALFTEVGTATVRLELRFWSGARQLETREARHAVIRAVIAGFRDAGVATGSDIQVLEPGPALSSILRGEPTRQDPDSTA